MVPESRYRPEGAADYSHRFHAGNIGDVWKHCVLVELLRRVRETGPRVAYIESHAGAGIYDLAATGEWTEGIGRLWHLDDEGNNAVERYAGLCRALGAGSQRPELYPGSPILARAVLRPDARLALWEQDEATSAQLTRNVGSCPETLVRCGDGLAALAGEIAEAEAGAEAVVVLVDPPFTQKADWTTIPELVMKVAAGSARATIMLWYPLKSLTRPNAMIARFRESGVAATVVELVTTPLDYQRRRLNGSGLLLVRPPAGALLEIAAAATALGARCATRANTWSLRVVSW